jgi:hypothetical protein
MKFLRDWSEVIGSCALEQQEYDLWVTAIAYHDETSNELVVYRDSYLREKATYGPDEYAYPAWLPAPDVAHRICSQDRAAEIAARIFAEWQKLLRDVHETSAQLEIPAMSRTGEDKTFEREMLDVLAIA